MSTPPRNNNLIACCIARESHNLALWPCKTNGRWLQGTKPAVPPELVALSLPGIELIPSSSVEYRVSGRYGLPLLDEVAAGNARRASVAPAPP
ncbi:hypothetical protein [Nitrosospira sp. Nsp13]|uniref:hypothetical protein n=1 Tax=Nitrosospira sp. Nsp13 TaxID=1855332 RepID=UPI0011131039|nr:hypothetical protein [Nitrosospira sp. Nsp13]